jgi:hypothetical protein
MGPMQTGTLAPSAASESRSTQKYHRASRRHGCPGAGTIARVITTT